MSRLLSNAFVLELMAYGHWVFPQLHPCAQVLGVYRVRYGCLRFFRDDLHRHRAICCSVSGRTQIPDVMGPVLLATSPVAQMLAPETLETGQKKTHYSRGQETLHLDERLEFNEGRGLRSQGAYS